MSIRYARTYRTANKTPPMRGALMTVRGAFAIHTHTSCSVWPASSIVFWYPLLCRVVIYAPAEILLWNEARINKITWIAWESVLCSVPCVCGKLKPQWNRHTQKQRKNYYSSDMDDLRWPDFRGDFAHDRSVWYVWGAIGHVFYQALLLRARCVVVSGCSMFHVGRWHDDAKTMDTFYLIWVVVLLKPRSIASSADHKSLYVSSRVHLWWTWELNRLKLGASLETCAGRMALPLLRAAIIHFWQCILHTKHTTTMHQVFLAMVFALHMQLIQNWLKKSNVRNY